MVSKGTALNPGNRMRKLYVTEALLSKYGRTSTCLGCMKIPGSTHDDTCRKNIEDKMLKDGSAFEVGEAAKREES